MNPRITSMENLIASDPGERNVFELVVSDQLRLAAQSLRLARRVGIVSGFFIRDAGAGETDGPPGAVAVGNALQRLGIPVDYITDRHNAPLFKSLGLRPIVEPQEYLGRNGDTTCTSLPRTPSLQGDEVTHLVSIERAGRGRDGRYRNMQGRDISDHTAPLDDLFLEAAQRGITTIGIGDGGNEIGMGNVFAAALAAIPHGREIASVVPTDFCIAAGVSNWGAYGLAGALSVLTGQDLLPGPGECVEVIETIVRKGGAVDGRTHRREPTVDGLPLSESLRMLEDIRSLIAESPLRGGGPLCVGILGYGQTGRAAAKLLTARGHRVRVSDAGDVSIEPGVCIDGVESRGHSIDFLGCCDLVVASPGVRPDSPIRSRLHARGIPVMSELEMAYQLCDRPIIAATGTVGKRSTVELIQRLFHAAGRELLIGGNKGEPLSALLAADSVPSAPSAPIALAVSSFQLETVVHFRPGVAVLLNIDEAHMDRHRSIAEYLRIKSRVFMNHRPDDVLILPYDDQRLRALARKHHGRTLFISSRREVERGAWISGDRIFVNLDGRVEPGPPLTSNPPHPENLLAATLVARLHGIA